MLTDIIKMIVHIAGVVVVLQACAHGPHKGRVIEKASGRPVADDSILRWR